jgi:TolA-binding protein
MAEKTTRVAVAHKAAADVINGVLFAQVGDVRVSEKLTADQAEAFCKNPALFSRYAGPASDAEIDKALDTTRATKAAAINRVQDDARLRLEETRAALRNTQAELGSLRKHVEELEKRPSNAELEAAHRELSARYTELEKLAATRAQRISELEAAAATPPPPPPPPAASADAKAGGKK